eukprot:1286047-Pyramimonas_sp.AAC.1
MNWKIVSTYEPQNRGQRWSIQVGVREYFLQAPQGEHGGTVVAITGCSSRLSGAVMGVMQL